MYMGSKLAWFGDFFVVNFSKINFEDVETKMWKFDQVPNILKFSGPLLIYKPVRAPQFCVYDHFVAY